MSQRLSIESCGVSYDEETNIPGRTEGKPDVRRRYVGPLKEIPG